VTPQALLPTLGTWMLRLVFIHATLVQVLPSSEQLTCVHLSHTCVCWRTDGSAPLLFCCSHV
jgi:hypothetical protein